MTDASFAKAAEGDASEKANIAAAKAYLAVFILSRLTKGQALPPVPAKRALGRLYFCLEA
jgi:hypothetical protein